jgi:hypothetical protein
MLKLGTSFPASDPFSETYVLNEAGAFSVFTTLADIHPRDAAITNAELDAASQCLSCEWEEELD